MAAENDLQHGWHLLELGRPVDAMRRAGKAIASDPDSGPAHTLLASCLVETRRWPEANRTAERAVALSPEDATALLALMSAREGAGRLDEAMDAALDALEADPHDPLAHYSAARLMLDHPGGNALTAKRHAEQAVALDPQDADNHVLLGHVQMALGDKRAADQSYRIAARLAPENEFAVAALARRQVSLLRVGSAPRLLALGMRAHPNAQALHQSLAGVISLLAYQVGILLTVGWLTVGVLVIAESPWRLRAAAATAVLLLAILMVASKVRHLPRGAARSPAHLLRQVSLPRWSAARSITAAVSVPLLGYLPLSAATAVAVLGIWAFFLRWIVALIASYAHYWRRLR